ncbi:MAG: SRPBCC family protein [Solirubrobacteraceae bacterium]
MDPITVSATISRPREEVFEYLADIANHSEFTDHYLVDWRLTRENSYGRGAGARFRIKAPLARFAWGDMTFADVQPPYRIIEHGRSGKFNRVRMLGTYTLSPGPSGTTVVEYTLETVPVMLSDRLMDMFGGRSWTRRQVAKSLRRLRRILEENRDRGQRATVAGRN